MKKVIAVLLCLLFVFSFAACGDKNDDTPSSSEPESEIASVSLEDVEFDTVSSKDEYDSYHKIVFDKNVEEGELDTEIIKTGTFAVLYDYFSDTTRYYVWGYKDNEMKDDWQWEIEIEDDSSIPKVGSTVEVKGKLANDEKALDKYWITQADITVKKESQKADAYDINLAVMSNTLTRVQLSNMQNFKVKCEGKTVALCGKVSTENLVSYRYSDELWAIHVLTDEQMPEKGTVVFVVGVFSEGVVKNAKIKTIEN